MISKTEFASLMSPRIVLIDRYKNVPEAKERIFKLCSPPITKSKKIIFSEI